MWGRLIPGKLINQFKGKGKGDQSSLV